MAQNNEFGMVEWALWEDYENNHFSESMRWWHREQDTE